MLRHTIKNRIDDQGVCSICGPVYLSKEKTKNGKVRWRCKLHHKNRTGIYHQKRGNNRWRKINFAKEQFNQMFVDQNGQCAICKKNASELKKSLAVDHDHRTGKIRGLLCFRCNLTLGLIFDDEKIAIAIIEYLKKNK